MNSFREVPGAMGDMCLSLFKSSLLFNSLSLLSVVGFLLIFSSGMPDAVYDGPTLNYLVAFCSFLVIPMLLHGWLNESGFARGVCIILLLGFIPWLVLKLSVAYFFKTVSLELL